MSKLKLFAHQEEALRETENLNRCAYYHDMGLGKTFTGAEKMMRLGAKVNLIICQKSKVDDWVEHIKTYYADKCVDVWDLTNKASYKGFFITINELNLSHITNVAVINYELAFRRPQLKKLSDFTLMLDESSMIQNENAKRTKFILGLNPKNVILLSGTPTAGKYENLWSQCSLLGWNISKDLYWRQYIDTEILDNEGYPIKVVRGYKNVERLKRKLRMHGAMFLKTEDVLCLPEQLDQTIRIPTTKEYRIFRKDRVITLDTLNLCEFKDDSDFYGMDVTPRVELVGDTILTKMLYERQLCGQYNKDKLDAFRDLVQSTEDRLIVFYNFTEEMNAMLRHTTDINRDISVVNGQQKDLWAYNNCEDSVTFVQYQAGAMGLNLQKANKIIYFTPPLSSELFEQSKKRTHRIGQERSCFYYYLTCRNSIEEDIYATLEMRRDYTDALFEEGEKNE